MSREYWENLYQVGDTRWDKGEASPGLVDFLAEQSSRLPRGSVLVPGCGRGHDARAWASAGFSATGLDVAPSAVRDSREQTATGIKAEFREGNFLQDEPFERFDYIFEHTLFCAINPGERDNYVIAARRWLKPDGRFVAVFYLIPDTEGPPFGTTREEVRARFEGSFVLEEDWVPRSYPNRTGLEWMTVWRPRNDSAANKER